VPWDQGVVDFVRGVVVIVVDFVIGVAGVDFVVFSVSVVDFAVADVDVVGRMMLLFVSYYVDIMRY